MVNALPALAQTSPSLVMEPSCNISFYGTFGSKAADAKVGRAVKVAPEQMLDQDRYAYERSGKIALSIGTSFGVLRQINNIKDDTSVQLVISHPEMINPNGQASTKTIAQSKIANLGDLYRFDLPYAMVAGNWTFDYQYRGKSLCKQVFELR